MMAKRKLFMLLVALILTFNFTIINSYAKDKAETMLRERIECVYKALKERDFDKFLTYNIIESDELESREKIIMEMVKGFPVLVDYKIKKIKITGNKARVKVTITIKEDNKKYVSDSFDYWVFKNKNWYLFDFGKIK